MTRMVAAMMIKVFMFKVHFEDMKEGSPGGT